MKHVENIILIICHILSLVFIDNVPSLHLFQKHISCCVNGENVQCTTTEKDNRQKIKKENKIMKMEQFWC